MPTKAIKLWVDDLRKAPEGWHWAKTITEAIRMLSMELVAVVAIDHDIMHAVPRQSFLPIPQEVWDTFTPEQAEKIRKYAGDGIEVPIACAEDYSAVAHYIAAMTIDERPSEVWVHTANPVGSGNIHNILKPCIGMVVYRGFHPDWKKENT